MIDLQHGFTWDDIIRTYHIEKKNKDGTTTKIPILSKKDLIPYYPYIICVGAWNKDDGAHLILSSESWVDTENRNICDMYIDSFKQRINKAKRNCRKVGRDFDMQECFEGWLLDEKNVWHHDLDPAYKDAVEQAIANNWKKDKIEYKYSKMSQYYRNLLREEMIANDIDPSEFGY